MRTALLLLLLLLTWLALALPALAQDRDGDGLSDFAELHKYRTDPDQADSDGDGTPDGEGEERREFSYSLRTVLRVLRPAAPISDDFQDARVVRETPRWLDIEVIHYPLSTAPSALRGDPLWRQRRPPAGFEPYTRSGLTSSFDAESQQALVSALGQAGIDVRRLDDKTLVERASAWLLKHARPTSPFTTFYVSFKDGRATVPAALRPAVQKALASSGRSLVEHWRRELFAREMLRTGQRGSCTSTAIYLAGCLRALGIPTRLALTYPLIDRSDAMEVAWIGRLKQARVKACLTRSVQHLSGSWASHTLVEVYVGRRWRYLNYGKLGHSPLDAEFGGLLTRVLTVADWSEAGVAETIGLRQGLQQSNDVFGGTNPYSAIELSERFGAHAKK